MEASHTLRGEGQRKHVGAVAVGIRGVLRFTGRGERHQVVPKATAAEQGVQDAAAGCSFAGNGDRLARTAEDRAGAGSGIKRAGGIGIGESGKERADAGGVGHPTGPAKAGGAADESTAKEEVADADFVLAGDAEHVLHEIAEGHFLNDHWGEGDVFGGFGAEFDSDGLG